MTSSRPPILVVAGPTATGKTAAAVDIALRHGGEIVGADSVQVYRGFDIGSAKPTDEELQGVPHHRIDVLDPDQSVDAVEYARMADEVIDRVAARGALPIVVGGTGLYLTALLEGLAPIPEVEESVRKGVQQKWEELGGQAEEFLKRKPDDEADPRRRDASRREEAAGWGDRADPPVD